MVTMVTMRICIYQGGGDMSLSISSSSSIQLSSLEEYTGLGEWVDNEAPFFSPGRCFLPPDPGTVAGEGAVIRCRVWSNRSSYRFGGAVLFLLWDGEGFFCLYRGALPRTLPGLLGPPSLSIEVENWGGRERKEGWSDRGG